MSQLAQIKALILLPSSMLLKQQLPSLVCILCFQHSQTLILPTPDLLGSVAFNPVKNDMIGNIKKVRERQLASPSDSSTLQSLCKSELASKSHKATEGLLWLVRGLDFTAQALRADLTNNAGISITEQKPKKELADSFRDAYKGTLAPHHSFMIKPIFSAAMSATPYRKDLYAKMLGEGAEATQFQTEEEKWLGALEERISILNAFLASKEAKW